MATQKKDHHLKNEILKELLRATHDSPCTPRGIADKLDISLERASWLLEQIEQDHRLAQSTYPHQYIGNKDTKLFLESGGYKQERFFKRNPAMEKIFTGAIVGTTTLLVGLIIQKAKEQSSYLLERKQDSAISRESLRLDSVQSFLKDSLPFRVVDTSKHSAKPVTLPLK